MVDHRDDINIKIGILGCGAIGSGIAKAIENNLNPRAKLAGIYDINLHRSQALAQEIDRTSVIKDSFQDLINSADLVVEAVNAENTAALIKDIIIAKKTVLVMSVGKLLSHPELLDLASSTNVNMLVPSGAIAGIDALKAASLSGINSITLNTYKPPKGLKGAPYIKSLGIDLDGISDETIIFDGNVTDAVQAFPQNINVAATLALATHTLDKLRIQIITSPKFTNNRHEIAAEGKFGHISTMTTNVASPENPKTSQLAILSGIEAVNRFCSCIKIGT